MISSTTIFPKVLPDILLLLSPSPTLIISSSRSDHNQFGYSESSSAQNKDQLQFLQSQDSTRQYAIGALRVVSILFDYVSLATQNVE
jgi:hypothetical protein